MSRLGRTEVIYTGIEGRAFLKYEEKPGFVVGAHFVRRPIVALIARFDESQKGFNHFWEMARIIHEAMPQVNFVIVGAPVNDAEREFKSRLEALAAGLKIQDVIFYAGFVKDLPNFFPSIDVVVIPSVYEAPSAVAMEAAAAGKPVVAFAVGGIPEVVRDGETGYLLPYGNARGLAEKTMLLLHGPQQAGAMGERGRIFMKNNFSQRKLAEQYMKLYESLASQI